MSCIKMTNRVRLLVARRHNNDTRFECWCLAHPGSSSDSNTYFRLAYRRGACGVHASASQRERESERCPSLRCDR